MAASGDLLFEDALSPAAARREALAHAVGIGTTEVAAGGAINSATILAFAADFEKYLTGDQS